MLVSFIISGGCPTSCNCAIKSFTLSLGSSHKTEDMGMAGNVLSMMLLATDRCQEAEAAGSGASSGFVGKLKKPLVDN